MRKRIVACLLLSVACASLAVGIVFAVPFASSNVISNGAHAITQPNGTRVTFVPQPSEW